MEKTKRKSFLMILALIFILPFAFFLTACGGDNNETPEQRYLNYVTCSLATNVNYTILSDTEISISKDVRIREVINNSSFVVTAHYSNDETEILTEGYSFDIYDENGGEYKYRIEVSYDGNNVTTIFVKVETEILPTLTNVAPKADSSGYYLTKELRYNPEYGAYNVLGEITTSDAEPDNLLMNLVAANKVYVDTEFGGTTVADVPNTYYQGSGYTSHNFRICANDGYKWVIDGEDVTYFDIYWQVKRAILETPELTSGTEFTFRHEWNSTQQKFVPVAQGLTFDYKGNENYFLPMTKETRADNYYWSLAIKDEYQDYYAMIINGEESTRTQDYAWSIAPMQVAMPTITDGTVNQADGTIHYTYTGEEIQPTIASDVLNLFEITRSQNSTNASEYSIDISISLKDDYYNSQNYIFNSGTLSYYIDRAIFPQNILEDLQGINFTLEKEYSANTYQYYVQWLSMYDFTNSDSDLEKTQYNEHSHLEFELPDELPNGITATTVLDVNENGYPVKVRYYYDYTNYQPIGFTATLYLTPIGYEVSDSWYLWRTSLGYSGDVQPNGLVYDEDTTYDCYLISINDSDLSVSYTFNYGVNENLGSTTQTIKDSGYYSVVANVTPKNGTTNYFIYRTGDSTKTPITQLTYPTFQIAKKTIYDYANYAGDYTNFYYVPDTTRNVAISAITNSDYKNFVDMTSIQKTVQYRANENADWAEAQNTIDVGQYKTTFTWTIADGFAKNYQLENGGAVKEWEIYPNTYNLQTTDKTAPDYIGWNQDDITLYYGDEQAEYALKNYVTLPNGLSVSFSFENNPYHYYQKRDDVTSENFSDNTYYTRSGEDPNYVYTVATIFDTNETYYIYTWGYTGESSWCGYDLGDYLAWAKFDSFVYDGNDKITVTVDDVDVTAKSYYYITPWVHFEIVEHEPIEYVIGNEQEFARTGYKYFAFTTGNSTDYILKTNNQNAYFGLRLATETDYSDLNLADLSSNLRYAIITGLTPNTQYVLKISEDNWSTQDNFTFVIEPYSAQFTNSYNAEIEKNSLWDGDSDSAAGLIVAGVANIGPEVYVPQTFYATNGETYGIYAVHALAEDAFRNNTTLTTIHLPAFIYNIGSNAFAGCTNLTDIYYENASGNWEGIIFGENVFEGCGPITVHTSDGNFHLDNTTHLLTRISND